MDKAISSIHNPRVKQWAELLVKKGRDKHGQYIVEGPHLVKEALTSGAQIECVVYEENKPIPEELTPYRTNSCEWIQVSRAVLEKCTSTQTPQGVFAVVSKSHTSDDLLWKQDKPLIVVLDQVQDPGNVGTIIRCAEASGASGILVGKGSADIYNPKTVRSTMGSLFRLPIIEGDLIPYVQTARRKGIHVVSTGLTPTSRSCYDLDWNRPIWFVVGNEGAGVSAPIIAEVDELITIPMLGKAESLNAAMATTVLLFEAMRQRAFA